MTRHFHEELEALKQTLLAMGGLVEDQMRHAMQALVDRDDALANEVIERDRQVDRLRPRGGRAVREPWHCTSPPRGICGSSPRP